MKVFRARLCIGAAMVVGLVACSSSDPTPATGPTTTAMTPGGGGGQDAGSATLFGADAMLPPDPTKVCAPSPANYDFPGNNCDDDGDGTVDNPQTSCDSGLALTGDGTAFASAMGICQKATATTWGLVSAVFTNTYGAAPASPLNDAQHGIMSKFGSVVVPREGMALGVLSSGFAREYDDAAGTTKAFKGQKTPPMQATANPDGSLPPGFPKSAAGCPSQDGTSTHDLIDVKLTLRVPANANGFQFDFNFWSGEWPEYVCSNFNDAFIAYLTSKSGTGNVSFDGQNNPVSVNNGFFDRCTPNTETGCLGSMVKTAMCPGGAGDLAGTGFDDPGKFCTGEPMSSGGGATGWLTTKAPVTTGETITLEFIIWDVGDPSFDSSVLLDKFQWVQGVTTAGTQRPPN